MSGGSRSIKRIMVFIVPIIHHIDIINAWCHNDIMDNSGVYSITNTISGNRYIGSSHIIKKRWISHRAELRRNKHRNQRLQQAWQKHGEAAFLFEVLELVPNRDGLFDKEQAWIDKLNPQYNIKSVAGGRGCGWNHSEETKEGLRQFHLGLRHSPEALEKIRKANAEIGLKHRTPLHTCMICGKTYHRKASRMKAVHYCSRQCSGVGKKINAPKSESICRECKQPFSHAARLRPIYCSHRCGGKGKIRDRQIAERGKLIQ